MAKILGNFHLALLIGVVLLVAAMFGLHGDAIGDGTYLGAVAALPPRLRRHALDRPALLFQLRPDPDHAERAGRAEAGRHQIYRARGALFWFRWSALATVILGLLVAEMTQGGYSARALEARADGYRTIGIGMWLGLIMAANVWFVIWPNQKKALGIVPADDAAKARAASVAMMASRTNLILSIPMLYCMVAQTHIGG